jgi:uncharacterized protein (TIGR03437 family)
MDAAHKLLKNLAILLVLSLLMTAAGWSQTLQAPSAVTIGSSGSNFAFVTSSASPTEITYTIGSPDYSIDSTTSLHWLTVSPASGTSLKTVPAPGNELQFTASTAGGLTGTHSAKVTLTPTAPTGLAAVTITVTFTGSGTGGGGGSNVLTASMNPVPLNALANSATSGTVNVTNTSANALNVTVTPTSTGNWLSVNPPSATIVAGGVLGIGLFANSASLTSGVTYQGTVTVTPSTGTALTITVNFNVGTGGGGNGTWSVSPSSIPWTYTTNGGFASQFVTVTTTSGASSYNVNTQSTSNWLLGSTTGIGAGTNFSVPVGTGFTLQLSAVVASLSQGTYTGQAFISDPLGNQQAVVTVTLTVNGGNSSGLGISPNPVTFNAAVNGAQQSQTVTVSSNIGGTISLSGTPPAGLSYSQPNNSVVSPGGSVSFTVFANPAGLAANTYSFTIGVTVGSQSGTVNVNLIVGGGSGGTGTTAVAPTTLSFAYQLNTNPAFIAQQKLVITGPSGAWTSSIFTQDSGTWLKLTPNGGSNLPNPASPGDAPIVSIDPTNLGVGSYNGTITINTPGGTQRVSVSLNVVSSTILLPTPGTLIFTAQTGQGLPASQSVYFSDSDSGLNVNVTPISAVANNSWITITTGTSSVVVSVNQSSLSTGTYSGSISVSQTGAANSPTTVPILLVVNGGGSGGNTGTLTFSPSSMSFSSVNGSTPSAQTLSVTANSSTSFVGSITYASGSGSWLTVSPTSGVTPSNLNVSVSPAGLAAGTYSATISFNANGVIQTVPVTLTVSTSGGGNSGNVTVSPSSFTFTSQQGSSPAAQSLSINSASGTAGVGFTVTVTSGSNWLATSANAINTTPSSLTVSVNSAALTAGTYSGNIAVQPTGGTTVNIPVSLTVSAPNAISATPTTLTFNYRAGDTAPAAQAVTVSGTSLTFTATASSTGNWLVATPTTGTAPATVNVSVNPTGLSAGTTYTGTVVIAGSGGATGSSTINVSLSVTAPLPTVTKVTNAASYAAAGVSPGEIITLFASDPAHPIGPATPAGLTLDSNGLVSTSIGGVGVTVGGFACPMIYASATQVSAVVPYEIKQFVSANIVLKFLGQSSNGIPVSVVTTSPGLFTANSSGTGPGAIANSDGSTNAPANPAARGSIVVVYLTGEGATSPAGVTGKVTTVASAPPLTPAPLLPISITIGGQGANYTFAGEAPGFVSGVLQLNVVVPTNITAGDQPIVVTIGGNPSQQGVTVSVK